MMAAPLWDSWLHSRTPVLDVNVACFCYCFCYCCYCFGLALMAAKAGLPGCRAAMSTAERKCCTCLCVRSRVGGEGLGQ